MGIELFLLGWFTCGTVVGVTMFVLEVRDSVYIDVGDILMSTALILFGYLSLILTLLYLCCTYLPKFFNKIVNKVVWRRRNENT